jgi:hypothetical protein
VKGDVYLFRGKRYPKHLDDYAMFMVVEMLTKNKGIILDSSFKLGRFSLEDTTVYVNFSRNFIRCVSEVSGNTYEWARIRWNTSKKLSLEKARLYKVTSKL